ncbi:MAG: hypothetical protein ACLFPF_10220 [Halanaerobiales bacterium]
MEVLDDLRECVEALDTLKKSCIENIEKDYYQKNVLITLNSGKYIAYSTCHSMLVGFYLNMKRERMSIRNNLMFQSYLS